VTRVLAFAAEATDGRVPTAATGPRVIVAVDGSASSQVAIESGLRLARDFGARLTFVSVYRPPPGVLGRPFHQRVLGKRLNAARTALAKARAAAERAGVEAGYELIAGKPAEELARLARLRDVDLVVVGSRDLPRRLAGLLGSVSRALVGEADRAVLVAKGPRDGLSDGSGAWLRAS
jgi:nucleotide-binding universal stress UspA family protein